MQLILLKGHLKTYIALDGLHSSDLFGVAPISQAETPNLRGLNNSVLVCTQGSQSAALVSPSAPWKGHMPQLQEMLLQPGYGASVPDNVVCRPCQSPSFTQSEFDLPPSARTEDLLFKKFGAAGVLPKSSQAYFLLS